MLRSANRADVVTLRGNKEAGIGWPPLNEGHLPCFGPNSCDSESAGRLLALGSDQCLFLASADFKCSNNQ